MIKQSKTAPLTVRSKPLFICVFMLVTCLLSACSSSPRSLTYYLLHSTGDASYTTEETSKTVILDKLTLPEYLKQRGLVYQTSNTNIHISTSHLWAEPVDEGLTKALTNKLVKQSISLVRPDHYASEEAIHMALHINDFVSTHEGEVIFSGQYVITRVSGEVSVSPFLINTPLENDGFSSSINAMRNAIAQLAKNIKKTINKTG